MTNTAEHLEHAEHAQHHAHDPFDRLVAITMAIVAAILASVTLLSHRAHTDTVRLQAEANILQTKASDQWSYYQAKNIRTHEYTAYVALIDDMAKEPGKEAAAKKVREDWAKQVKKYRDEDLPKMKEDAEKLEEQAKERQEEGHLYHRRSDYFDLGELAVELGLVFCSLAVLTKIRPFWYGGILAGGVGLAIALAAFYFASVEMPEKPATDVPEAVNH